MLYQLSYTPGGTAKDKDDEAPRHGAMGLQGRGGGQAAGSAGFESLLDPYRQGWRCNRWSPSSSVTVT